MLFFDHHSTNQVTLWDLSVEKDTEEGVEDDLDEFPPQLLFYHHQKDVKEIHFHPQVPGLLICTGEEGISFFKPNITPEEGEEESEDEGEGEEDDDSEEEEDSKNKNKNKNQNKNNSNTDTNTNTNTKQTGGDE